MARWGKNTKMGRPRGFDEDGGPEAAIRVFWEEGYEGATLASLTGAMRINRSSMFAAFGNKEALFKKAFERYVSVHLPHIWEALEKPTIRECIEHALRKNVDFLSTPGNPNGCLSVHGALATSPDGDSVKQWLIRDPNPPKPRGHGGFRMPQQIGYLRQAPYPGTTLLTYKPAISIME